MKLLKMSPYCYPEQISSSHLSKDLDEIYIKNGIFVENYVPTPCRGISEETRNQYKKIKYEEIDDGYTIIHRFSMFKEGKNSVFRAVRYVLVNIIQYLKGSRAKNIDLVYGASTPPTQGLLCALTAKKLSKRYKKRVPFVFNLQDIFPDSLVHTGLTKKGSLIWKIGRKIEDYTYKNADVIIVISEGFKRNIMAKGVPEEKIVVIPNWVDETKVVYVEREKNPLFDKYNLDRNKFYICYSGNLGHTQNLNLLVDAAAKLKDNEDIGFVIIGEGAEKEKLEQRVSEENLTNVTMLPFQDYSDIACVFSLGDMGLLISKKGVGNNSVPSKTWSIMSASRPVLASFDKGSDIDEVINDIGCGVCVDADDCDALVNEILTAYQNKEALAEMGKKGREYIENFANKTKCTGEYVEILKGAITTYEKNI